MRELLRVVVKRYNSKVFRLSRADRFRNHSFQQRPMSNVTQRYTEAEKLKNSGKPEEAAQILRSLLEDDPSHALSHMALARILTGLSQHEDAVAHAEKACELEPDDAINFSLLSLTYQRAFAGTGDQRYIRMAEDAMARSRSL
jgi:Flp pilus assembly protein TadD